MNDYQFRQVDVFTDRQFGGNSLAVIPDAYGLSDSQMQSLANEMNLSETTFVFPPTDPEDLADVRIFTPGIELPFAGHPTVGTAFVLASLGRVAAQHFSFQERIGRLPIRLEGDPRNPAVIWMTQPLPTFGPAVVDRERVAKGVGLSETDLLPQPIRSGTAGVPFLFIPLRDPETVDRARTSSEGIRGLQGTEDCNGGPSLFS